MEVTEVSAGAADDPFSKASQTADPTASNAGVVGPQTAETVRFEPAADSTATQVSDPTAQAAVVEDEAGDDELTEEELSALEALFQERINTEVLPKVSSAYDRQIAAITKRLEAVRMESSTREESLLKEVREAKLNGLTDEDKAKLRAQWEFEDERRRLDEYKKSLDDYSNAVTVTQYIAQYPHLELTAEDFADFSTPEEMAYFVTIADAEYWKAVAKAGGLQAFAQESEPARKTAAAEAAAAIERVPAGATAPTNADGGGAPPSMPKFNAEQSRQAMIDNISTGWEVGRITR